MLLNVTAVFIAPCWSWGQVKLLNLKLCTLLVTLNWIGFMVLKLFCCPLMLLIRYGSRLLFGQLIQIGLDLSYCISARLQIRQFITWYAGFLGGWDKWLVDQASDFPSIFFIISYRLRALKTLYFHFCNFIKKNQEKFECVSAKDFARFYEKKYVILGTSDAWSTSHLSHRPNKRAYYIVDCRIFHG